MFWYVLRRVLIAVPLLLGITFISFLVIHLAPGDPVDFHTGDLSPDSSAQAKQMLRKQYFRTLVRARRSAGAPEDR